LVRVGLNFWRKNWFRHSPIFDRKHRFITWFIGFSKTARSNFFEFSHPVYFWERNIFSGVILQLIDSRGSYYMITVYQWYSSKMYLKRKHLFHWLRWWRQNWNWTPLSRINEFFKSGSNYNMLIYDSYPDNIPIIRKHFLSWVHWWPSLSKMFHFLPTNV